MSIVCAPPNTKLAFFPFCRPRLARPHLLADHFDQHALVASAVKLAVEDLLPRPEVELSFCDRHDYVAAHHLAFVVRVPVILAGAIVVVALGTRIVRGEPLQPAFVILVQSWLVVIDENAGSDVHRIDEAEALAYATGLHRSGDFRRDVDEFDPLAR